MPRAYLGLGSNLGDRLGHLARARLGLGRLGTIAACSSVYETAPWGDLDQGSFLNQCCELETDLDPRALHARTKDLERPLGRTPGRKWGPRIVDIDLLVYDAVRIQSEALTIPHPRIAGRAFVLVPLAEIAPSLVVPGLEASVSELLAAIRREPADVTPYAPGCRAGAGDENRGDSD